jgi:hypothetical protein
MTSGMRIQNDKVRPPSKKAVENTASVFQTELMIAKLGVASSPAENPVDQHEP